MITAITRTHIYVPENVTEAAQALQETLTPAKNYEHGKIAVEL